MNQEKVLFDSLSVAHVSFEKKMYFWVKRVFDILVSIVGMMLLIPLAILVKIIYVCSGDFHSIFFKQERIGRYGKIFQLYKFRTMKLNADELLKEILSSNAELREEYEENKKLKHDPRITKAGSIIRKLSLDEFPQFINIFKGDMSLVGNRPYLPREREDMGNYYKYIVSTRPGLTGYWQVNGRSNTSFANRLRMEKYYSNNRGLWLDVKIIIKTVIQMFRGDGAI